MLDLAAIEPKRMDVKLPDGRVLHLKKPTKAFYDWLRNIGVGFTDLTERQIEENTYICATKILNQNDQYEDFTLDWVKTNLYVETADALVLGYVKFAAELTSDPN